MIGQFRAFSPRLGSSGIWLGAVGEILIVALGVLLAFGLNAWWVERSARSEEQTHLRALTNDFEQNVGIYTALIERQEGVVKASLDLLELARKQPDAEVAVVSPLLGSVFSSLRQEPALDAYQGLVNSAGLALIRDDELRSNLAGFAARVADPYSERFADELYMNLTTRFVGRLHVRSLVGQDSSPPDSYAELLTDPVFQEHLAFRHLIEREVTADYRRRLREAQEILAQLQMQQL